MFNPHKPQTDPPEEKKTDPELIKRFETKLKNESNLEFTSRLFQELPELEFYLVGGMVRDTILKHPTSKDYDFIARGVEMKKLVAVLQKMGRVDFVGRNFGVIKFTPTGSTLREPIDIALPRTELPVGTGGYRDVEAKSDHTLPIEEDLSRRDLTINAIAWNMGANQLVDPFNGQEDLRNKKIRCVGRPEDRFQEDYSRMLRAIRFACRLDFEIEPQTKLAIMNLMPHINDQREIPIVESLERQMTLATNDLDQKKLQSKIEKQKQANPNAEKQEFVVPRETIAVELLKSLKENPARALELLDEFGALEKLLPEVLKLKGCEQPAEFHAEGDVWQHTKMMLEKIRSEEFRKYFKGSHITGEFALGVILHDIGKPETKQTPEDHGVDRVRFNSHDTGGAKIVGKIATRFNLSDFQTAKLKFMVENHMFAMTITNIFNVSTYKFARRFIDSPHSQDLLMLFYLDANSSIRPDGSSPMNNFLDTLKRINQIKQIRTELPEEKFADGQIMMQTLEIKGGPLIGALTYVMSDLIDSGKISGKEEAVKFLQKNKALILEYKDKVRGNNREEVADEILKRL